jgi:peptidyl-prolyl cis-trans isomerase B (cyclophilin B)
MSLRPTVVTGALLLLLVVCVLAPHSVVRADNTPEITDKVFLDFDGPVKGRIRLGLFGKVAPRAVKNFVELSKREKPEGYKNSISHRLIPNFMMQFGDFTQGNGMGGKSIYGDTFDDEPGALALKHTEPGLLSLANRGANTNGSQVFLTLVATPWLDGRHGIFGKVLDAESMAVLRKLEKVKTGAQDRPLQEIKIVDCGVLVE